MRSPAAILPLLLFLPACAQDNGWKSYAKGLGSAEWTGAIEAPRDVNWKCTIAEKGEPGEPLVVRGTIFKEDGRTPAPGILLYVYHTDSRGQYSRGTGSGTGPRHGKLRGWMLTGSDGKYEFRTVRPGGYPGRTDPQHIHATLTGPGIREHWIDEYWFEDDERVPRSELPARRDNFTPILRLEKKDGVWTARRDIRMLPAEQRRRNEGG